MEKIIKRYCLDKTEKGILYIFYDDEKKEYRAEKYNGGRLKYPQKELYQWEILNLKNPILLFEQKGYINWLDANRELHQDRVEKIKELEDIIGEDVIDILWREFEKEKREVVSKLSDLVAGGVQINYDTDENAIIIDDYTEDDFNESIDCSDMNIYYNYHGTKTIKKETDSSYGYKMISFTNLKSKGAELFRINIKGKKDTFINFGEIYTENRAFKKMVLTGMNIDGNAIRRKMVITKVFGISFEVIDIQQCMNSEVLFNNGILDNLVEMYLRGGNIEFKQPITMDEKINNVIIANVQCDMKFNGVVKDFTIDDACEGSIYFEKEPEKNNLEEWNFSNLHIFYNNRLQKWKDIGFDAWGNAKLKGKILGNQRKEGKRIISVRKISDTRARLWFESIREDLSDTDIIRNYADTHDTDYS